MSWRSDLTRLGSRSWGEWTLGLQAFLLLGVFRGATLLLPFAWITRFLRLTGGPPGGPALPFARGKFEGTGAGRVRWAVKAAAHRTPWESNCLPQALTALVLLRRRGLDSTLYLGVATEGESRELKAHAWLGVGGRVLLGERGLTAFSPISAFARAGGDSPRR